MIGRVALGIAVGFLVACGAGGGGIGGGGGGPNCTKGCRCGQACIDCDYNCTKSLDVAIAPDGSEVPVGEILVWDDEAVTSGCDRNSVPEAADPGL